MSRSTDQAAACLWLTRRNNPHLEDYEVRNALGWSRSTFYRRAQDLMDPSDHLRALLTALKEERILEDLTDPRVRIRWYQKIHDLLLIGTPPWGPEHFVDCDQQFNLHVPKGASINTYERSAHAVSSAMGF